MNQNELNRAVAHATGETISTIQQMGFVLVDPDAALGLETDQHDPCVTDWVASEPQRTEAIQWSSKYEPAAT